MSPPPGVGADLDRLFQRGQIDESKVVPLMSTVLPSTMRDSVRPEELGDIKPPPLKLLGS